MAGTDWGGLTAALVGGMNGNPMLGLEMAARNQKREEERQTLMALQSLVGPQGEGIMNPQILAAMFGNQNADKRAATKRQDFLTDRQSGYDRADALYQRKRSDLEASPGYQEAQARKQIIGDLGVQSQGFPIPFQRPEQSGMGPHNDPAIADKAAGDLRTRILFPGVKTQEDLDLIRRGKESTIASREESGKRQQTSLEEQIRARKVQEAIAALGRKAADEKATAAAVRQAGLDADREADRAKPRPEWVNSTFKLMVDTLGGATTDSLASVDDDKIRTWFAGQEGNMSDDQALALLAKVRVVKPGFRLAVKKAPGGEGRGGAIGSWR